MAVARNRRIAQSLKKRLRLESLEPRRLLAGDTALEFTRFQSDADLKEFLIGEAVEDWGELFGEPAWIRPFLPPGFCPECSFLDVDLGVMAAGGFDEGRPSHSDTNTQVAGVDEIDIVETDGDFLYMLSGRELLIADAWQPAETQIVSRVELEGLPVGQFLHGDRLTVVSQAEFPYYYDDLFFQGGPAIDVAFDVGIPIDYTEPKTRVTVFDVADRENPRMVQSTELDGNYVSARAIGEHVYLVSNGNFGSTHPEVVCEEATGGNIVDGDVFVLAMGDCHYETQESFTERIESLVMSDLLPGYSSSSGIGGTVTSGQLSRATDVFKPVTEEYRNLISVSVFDMSSDELGPVSTTSLPTTYTTTVYASQNSLYLTNPSWGLGRGGEASSIIRFEIADDGGSVGLAAVGEVPGRTLNSFSIDEYRDGDDTYLRVATTVGWGPESDNRVYVLQDSNDELTVVGQTTSLAPGEQIFAVRYVGQTAYVVTFVQTDPLFAIDLSEPTDPQVLGELHIPGFSNYLQPANENFLIGLGRNADPRNGRAQELQVSLFDVTDKTQPSLADRYTFDLPDWATTEAIGDHHALSYFPEHRVLTIPVTNGGWIPIDRNRDGRIDFHAHRPHTELYVFQLNMPVEDSAVEPGIEFLGTVQHHADVRRSVRIEEFLYSISSDSLAIHPLLDPATEIKRVNFGQDEVGVDLFQPDPDEPTFNRAVNVPEETAPQVARVMVAGSDWGQSVMDHLEATDGLDLSDPSAVVPFTATNQIKVQFTEDVFVDVVDLRIIGQGGGYAAQDFSYDQDTFTATWTLTNPLEADTVRLHLTGAIDMTGQRLDGNADGRAGGTFRHEFSVLSGDVDGDGRVDQADVASAMLLEGVRVDDDSYRLSHDVDGNGLIDNADYEVIASRIGSTTPGFLAPVPGDSNRDGIFDSKDLIAVMQAGKYRTGEFASLADGDWNRDGVFDESDLVFAFQEGSYSSAALAAAIDSVFDDDQ